MKVNRLLEITLILLNRKSVTAAELAERFEVSTRTIYRDIDDLSSAGVPVFASRGSSGGISLLENYAIDKAVLTDHERDGLIVALKTMQATKYPEIDAALEKIGGVFRKNTASDWVHIEFSPWGSGPNDENRFLDIKQAILQKRIISFDYVGSDGTQSRRTIEPMQLYYKGQAWYVWGYCLTRRDYRMFRISRMRQMEVTDRAYVRRPDEAPDDNAAAVSPKQLVTLKLRFQPQELYRVYDDYDEEKITRNIDGTCDVTFMFPEDEWLYGYITSFGPYVEVLEPPHIRDIIRERLKKSLSNYE